MSNIVLEELDIDPKETKESPPHVTGYSCSATTTRITTYTKEHSYISGAVALWVLLALLALAVQGTMVSLLSGYTFIGLVAVILAYTWSRCIKNPGLAPSRAVVVGVLIVHTVIIAFAAATLEWYAVIDEDGSVFAITIVLWIYTMLYLYFLMVLFFVDVAEVLVRASISWRGTPAIQSAWSKEYDTSRYHRIKAGVVFVMAFIVTLSAFFAGVLGEPTVEYVTLPIHELPEPFEGYRIAMLTDVHAGATVSKTQIARAVEIAMAENPDMLVVVGDLADGPIDMVEEHLKPIFEVSEVPVLVVTGNHDYLYEPAQLLAYLDEAPNVSLLNSRVFSLERDNTTLDFAGVSDYSVREEDEWKTNFTAIEETLTPGAPVIFLSHQPNFANELMDKFDAAAVLSGHVHKGQTFPISIISFLTNDYYFGLYDVAPHHAVYVSAGSLYWGVPVRLGSSSEVTLLTLEPRS